MTVTDNTVESCMQLPPSLEAWYVFEAPEDSPQLTPVARLGARLLVGLARGLTTAEGIIHEDKAALGPESGRLEKLYAKTQLLAGYYFQGKGVVTDIYGTYTDERVLSFMDDSQNPVVAQMPKIRTCELDPPPYDPTKTGTQVKRTFLGRILTMGWIDEFPQVLDKGPAASELVGPRSRKRGDLPLIPTSLKERDAQAYERPKGLIDASAPLRKADPQYADQAYRSVSDVVYDEIVDSEPQLKSAVIYETVKCLPLIGRLLRPMLPALVKNLHKMTRTESAETYQELIVDNVNKELAELGIDQVVLS
jgi:hypothetical protein